MVSQENTCTCKYNLSCTKIITECVIREEGRGRQMYTNLDHKLNGEWDKDTRTIASTSACCVPGRSEHHSGSPLCLDQ